MIGDFEKATIAWQRSVELLPTHYAYSNIGSSYFFLGRFEDAIEMYHRAIEIAPDDFETWGPQPADSCWIRVADDISHWEEGRSMIFDDTYYHEVRNDTDSWRVVLFVDFLRPLPFPVSILNKAAIYAVSKRKSVKDMRSYLENHQ